MAANRFASESPFNGTGGADFLLTPSPFVMLWPNTCRRSSPLHIQPKPKRPAGAGNWSRQVFTEDEANSPGPLCRSAPRRDSIRPDVFQEEPMTLAIRHIDAPLGVEVSGIDLSGPVSPDDVAAIEDAWRERLVVVFHGQNLSDPQLIAFSRNFGELDPPGPNPYGKPFLAAHPELNVISNVVENGKPIGNLGDGEAVWHADMTYAEVPPKAAMLHSLEVPPPAAGGNTHFANMFAAYETLPADLKR